MLLLHWLSVGSRSLTTGLPSAAGLERRTGGRPGGAAAAPLCTGGGIEREPGPAGCGQATAAGGPGATQPPETQFRPAQQELIKQRVRCSSDRVPQNASLHSTTVASCPFPAQQDISFGPESEALHAAEEEVRRLQQAVATKTGEVRRQGGDKGRSSYCGSAWQGASGTAGYFACPGGSSDRHLHLFPLDPLALCRWSCCSDGWVARRSSCSLRSGSCGRSRPRQRRAVPRQARALTRALRAAGASRSWALWWSSCSGCWRSRRSASGEAAAEGGAGPAAQS